MIRFEQVSKFYAEQTQVLEDVSFSVAAGEFLAIVGPSGSGKTTLLKLINRLLRPSRGVVRVAGVDVNAKDTDVIQLRRSIGYVFQRFGLFPHFTVEQNVALVPKLLQWSDAQIGERTRELLHMVGLEPDDYATRFPAQLSGGQQQRVALARALAAKPQIMLLDEPFGALDPSTRDNLQQQYGALHKKLNLTTVMVTHDVHEALIMADRLLVLEAGKMLQLGTPSELSLRPASPLVTELLELPRRQVRQLESVLQLNETSDDVTQADEAQEISAEAQMTSSKDA